MQLETNKSDCLLTFENRGYNRITKLKNIQLHLTFHLQQYNELNHLVLDSLFTNEIKAMQNKTL